MTGATGRRRSAFMDFIVGVTRTPISLAGSALTTTAAVLFASLWGMSLFGFRGGPYLGILAFVVIPSIFVFGLVLIPLGLWLDNRRARKKGIVPHSQEAFPVVDLNQPRTRRVALIVLAATLINVVLLAVAVYEGVEVMDSTEFCGTACHSVMAPEFTTYSRSPHSRVPCVSCHIGPGAGWFVKSKLSGSWQLVSVTFGLYPRPIPTPVHDLRPARETCEQCHWPTKFVGDKFKVFTHHGDDEGNSPVKNVLVLRVGGRRGSSSHGIHWHVDPGVAIRYRSDESRETIHEVELTEADGTTRVYRAKAAVAPAEANGDARPAEGESWRVMDCVDCHNRPTHVYRMPAAEIDRAMEEGLIDPSLPFVRRESAALLAATYASHDAARAEILERLRGFYAREYPARAGELSAKIDAAARTLGDIWCTNVFPTMNIVWGTYPNHIGHMDSPGCFRCHDGEHQSDDGRVIGQDCDTCHAVLAMEESDPEVLKALRP